MKEYVKFQASIFNTWKEKLLICWFYINGNSQHSEKIPVCKTTYIWKYEDLLLCKDSPAFELWVCCFTAHLCFSFYLTSQNSIRKSSILCNRNLGFQQAASPSESSQVTLHIAIVLGVSVPQLLRTQHHHMLEMSSEDAPQAFKILLEIMHLFRCHWRCIFSPLSLVRHLLAVKFV